MKTFHLLECCALYQLTF